MRILDRYVLFSFLRNYLISMMVLIGMFVVLDMVFNFDELVEVRGRSSSGGAASIFELISAISNFYFFQTFLIFVHLSGIIPVVAAGFTLIRMTRFNELSAVLAAGVPLLRVATPIILAAVVMNVLLILDQELLIPNIIPQLTRAHDQVHSSEARSFRIEMIQDDRGALLTASRYTPPGRDGVAVMREVDIFEYDQLVPIAHITADRADWDPQRRVWKLSIGQNEPARRVTGLRPEASRSDEMPVDTYRSNITPDEIALWKSGDFVSLLSTEQINAMLQRRAVYGALELQRVKHARFTQWIMNVILLMLAIPCLLARQPTELKTSIFKCLVLVGLCMAAIFLSYQIAGRPPAGPHWVDRWPAIWAWVPILVFGPLAVFLLDRLHSRRT